MACCRQQAERKVLLRCAQAISVPVRQRPARCCLRPPHRLSAARRVLQQSNGPKNQQTRTVPAVVAVRAAGMARRRNQRIVERAGRGTPAGSAGARCRSAPPRQRTQARVTVRQRRACVFALRMLFACPACSAVAYGRTEPSALNHANHAPSNKPHSVRTASAARRRARWQPVFGAGIRGSPERCAKAETTAAEEKGVEAASVPAWVLVL